MNFFQRYRQAIIWAGCGLITISIGLVWIWRIGIEQVRARDIQRVSDAVTIQTAFEKMFQHDRSYANAAVKGCDKVGQSVRRCSLREYYKDINQIFDPGKFDYVVTKVPDKTTYEVTFTLERNYEGITKGEHKITPEGIR
ncbi:MAG: hypothetical protein WC734_04865 [Patescibacteria group bacterium]|jgi:hypothetical protein